jgi:FAD/FMN-containing dehydrogenase
VPPARAPDLCRALELYGFDYEAQLGVGACLVGVNRAEDVATVRARAAEHGGHAIVLDAPDELRADAWGPHPPGLEPMRRIKHALDPARILNPGLAPGGL